jgi:hypothetical protein
MCNSRWYVFGDPAGGRESSLKYFSSCTNENQIAENKPHRYDIFKGLLHASSYCRSSYGGLYWKNFFVDFAKPYHLENVHLMLPTIDHDAHLIKKRVPREMDAQSAFQCLISSLNPTFTERPLEITFTPDSVLNDQSWYQLEWNISRLPQISRITLPGYIGIESGSRIRQLGSHDKRKNSLGDEDVTVGFCGSIVVRLRKG